MRLTSPDLQSALTEGLASGDPGTKAQADNIDLEENVADVRRDVFETDARCHRGSGWRDLYKRQRDYVGRYVYVRIGSAAVPHTFRNDMEPAARDHIDEEQVLVRLESLAWPLDELEYDEADLRNAWDENDRAFIGTFLDKWNGIRDSRPAFATFKREVADDLEAPDWAERLRDRLGLAHILNGPVALMVYPVREMLNAPDGACAITVPTVLDGPPSEYFFPVPRGLDYGHAMALSPCEGPEGLVSEILHQRLTYRADHVDRIGTLSAPLPPHDVAELRVLHGLALQMVS